MNHPIGQAAVPADLPLAGVRVLELCHIIAGPSATLILAELGAEVLKVENPQTGETGRNMPSNGSGFFFLNRNKQSLGLNLKSAEGKEVFSRLVARSDIVVENYGPGALKRLGVDYEWARRINPRIIYCAPGGNL